MSESPHAPQPARRTLVVLLHGFLGNPHRLRHVRRAVEQALPHAVDVFVPPLGLGVLGDHSETARTIVAAIDRRLETGSPVDDIVLVGHSVGALLARKVYVVACGETDEASFEAPFAGFAGRPWARRVRRIVLLAGMNRGWRIQHAMGPGRILFALVGTVLAEIGTIVRIRAKMLAVRCGGPFITNLRLQWLAMERRLRRDGHEPALTVQLLGTVDDVVSPDDNVDLVTGRSFVYLDVPRTGHESILAMDDSPEGRARQRVLVRALTAPTAELREESARSGGEVLEPVREDVTDVVFVVHGIRDRGYWTRRIARHVVARGSAAGRVFAMETSTYGYFAMLPFLLPWTRRSKVEWLMDRYTEARSRYPEARFSYVGHSNGTYLLAGALARYRSCRFANVVFMGSVVPTTYDWSGCIARRQVERVLNYVATSDWVVAWFPKAFQPMGADIGSAGHDGFESSSVAEIEYVPGPHGAALDERNWDAIAEFVVTGTEPAPRDLRRRRNPFVGAIGRVAIAVPVVVALVVFVFGAGLLAVSPADLKAAVLLVYAGVVWQVVTRV